MHKKNGLTLIELMCTLSIMGIIASAVLPCIGGLNMIYQNILLDTSIKELLSDLRLAQQKAKDEGYIYHVYFNSVQKSYMIYSYKDASNCVFKVKNLPSGISFDRVHSTYTNSKISFNSRGKPLPYPCTISLANSRGRYKKITITVGTDYISIKN